MLVFKKDTDLPKIRFQEARTADINIGYLAKADLYCLMRPTTPGVTSYGIQDMGFRCTIHEGEMLSWQLEESEKLGLSKRYCLLIRELAQQGYRYVQFDVEGGYVQGLKMLNPTPLESLADYKPKAPAWGPLEDEDEDPEEAVPQSAGSVTIITGAAVMAVAV